MRAPILLLIAAVGLIVPNGLFLYASAHPALACGSLPGNKLALAYMIDCFMVLGLLAFHYARSPIGPVKWYWFLLLSLLGGLGFSVPFFWWLNERKTSPSLAGA